MDGRRWEHERRIMNSLHTRTATQPGFCEKQLNQSEGNTEEKRNLVHGACNVLVLNHNGGKCYLMFLRLTLSFLFHMNLNCTRASQSDPYNLQTGAGMLISAFMDRENPSGQICMITEDFIL